MKRLGKFQKGIGKAVAEHGSAVASIGVDTWGVDYGRLDADGADAIGLRPDSGNVATPHSFLIRRLLRIQSLVAPAPAQQ